MPLTPEQRAEISRQNGAKSKGPVTPEGKEKSARNAVDHGRRAETLKHFAPPHYAALCNEERREYYKLLDELTATFQPDNPFARDLVRDMAVARWSILRLEVHITNQWNFALLEHAKTPATVDPDLAELEVMARANRALYSGPAILPALNREIDRLQLRILRLERALRNNRGRYPAEPNERTCQEAPQVVENKSDEPKAPESAEPEVPIFVTQNTKKVIEFYQNQFPGRRIVVLPAETATEEFDAANSPPETTTKVA